MRELTVEEVRSCIIAGGVQKLSTVHLTAPELPTPNLGFIGFPNPGTPNLGMGPGGMVGGGGGVPTLGTIVVKATYTPSDETKEIMSALGSMGFGKAIECGTAIGVTVGTDGIALWAGGIFAAYSCAELAQTPLGQIIMESANDPVLTGVEMDQYFINYFATHCRSSIPAGS